MKGGNPRRTGSPRVWLSLLLPRTENWAGQPALFFWEIKEMGRNPNSWLTCAYYRRIMYAYVVIGSGYFVGK